MDERVWEVLDAFAERQVLTAADLAARLGVTSRTVRNLLARSREALASNGIVLESKPGTGYIMRVTHPEAASVLLEHRGVERGVPSTAVGRRYHLLRLLLTAPDYVKLDDVAQSLYVAKKTVTSDLAQVEGLLAAHGLSVDRRPYRGVRVVGSELDVRACLATVYNASEREAHLMAQQVEPTISAAAVHVQDVLVAHGLQVSLEAMRTLVLHIAIATLRVRDGRSLQTAPEDLDDYVTEADLAVAGQVLDRLGAQIEVRYPRMERVYLALQLVANRAPTASAAASRRAVTVRARAAVDQMLAALDAGLGLSLSDDDSLRAALVAHTAPLLVRLRFRMLMPNPSLGSTRQAYPLAYVLAELSCGVLSRLLGRAVSSEEAGYMALWFALGLERRQPALRRRRLALLSQTDWATTQLIEMRVRESLGDLIESLVIVPSDRSRPDGALPPGTDLVLATQDPGAQVGAPVQVVSAFLGEADLRRIRRSLVRPARTDLAQALSEGVFAPHLRAATPQEAIAQLVGLARAELDMPRDLDATVLDLEAAAPTDVGNRVAVPHAPGTDSQRSLVALGVLDEPILWSRHQVQVVCLVSPSCRLDRDPQRFYQDLARLLMSPRLVEDLIASRDLAPVVLAARSDPGQGAAGGL